MIQHPNDAASLIFCGGERTKNKIQIIVYIKGISCSNLLFLRMHCTIQPATTPIMHSVNTSAPTIVAIRMIGCLIFTTNSFRSIETEFRMITKTVNDFTFKTLCAYSRFCWHTSIVDHFSHVSSPSIMYGPSMCRIQYSKFGEPLQ